MRTFASSLPWFLPGMIPTLLLALALARPLGRRLGGGAIPAFVLVLALGAIGWATLPPDAIQLGPAPGFATCDMRRFGPADPLSYLRLSDTSLNVVLFVPYGLAVGWLWSIRSRWLLLGLGVVAPFVIEAWQSLLPVLGRGCQTGDLVDNLLGLAIGVTIGIATARMFARPRPDATQA